MIEFDTWKTITLATGPEIVDASRDSIKELGLDIGHWVGSILSKSNEVFEPSDAEIELDLFVTDGRDFDFLKGASREEIRDWALKFSEDQPKDEWLLIVMEPIIDSDDNFKVCVVEQYDSDGRWLYGFSDNRPYGSKVRADDLLVFVRRK